MMIWSGDLGSEGQGPWWSDDEAMSWGGEFHLGRTGELEISGEIDLQFFGENWSCSMGFQPTGSKHIMRYPISYANLSTGQRMGCGQFETKLEPVLYVSHNN